jgi:hypothetical protein
MNTDLVSTSVRTPLTPPLFNGLRNDAARQLSMDGAAKTVASGAVTVAPSDGEGFYSVDTEGGAGADDLDTINGGVSGDIINLILANVAHVVKLKHATGNISLPGGADLSLTADMAVTLRHNGSVWMIVGGAGGGVFTPTETAFLTLSTSYQDLVAAPASGVYQVSSIVLSNEDATVGTDFYLKVIRSAVDYVPIQIFLNAGERLLLAFPWKLDTNTKIQAKVGATCAGHAVASYGIWAGAAAVLNFTGTAWQTIFTASKKSVIEGACLVNNEATTQTLGLQVIDGSSNVKMLMTKTLTQGSAWFIDPAIDLPIGYALQTKQGAASKVGSAFVPYKEL